MCERERRGHPTEWNLLLAVSVVLILIPKQLSNIHTLCKKLSSSTLQLACTKCLHTFVPFCSFPSFASSSLSRGTPRANITLAFPHCARLRIRTSPAHCYQLPTTTTTRQSRQYKQTNKQSALAKQTADWCVRSQSLRCCIAALIATRQANTHTSPRDYHRVLDLLQHTTTQTVC